MALYLPQLGTITIDVSFAGNFIALARAQALTRLCEHPREQRSMNRSVVTRHGTA